jgi:hypothetical protein
MRSSRPTTRAPRSRTAGAWPGSVSPPPSSKDWITSALTTRSWPQDDALARSSEPASPVRTSTQAPRGNAAHNSRSGSVSSTTATSAILQRGRPLWQIGTPDRLRTGPASPACSGDDGSPAQAAHIHPISRLPHERLPVAGRRAASPMILEDQFCRSFTRPIWRAFFPRSFRQRATLAGNPSCSRGSAATSQEEGGGVHAARLCAVGAYLGYTRASTPGGYRTRPKLRGTVELRQWRPARNVPCLHAAGVRFHRRPGGRLGPQGHQAQDGRSSTGACLGMDDTLSLRHCMRSRGG